MTADNTPTRKNTRLQPAACSTASCLQTTDGRRHQPRLAGRCRGVGRRGHPPQRGRRRPHLVHRRIHGRRAQARRGCRRVAGEGPGLLGASAGPAEALRARRRRGRAPLALPTVRARLRALAASGAWLWRPERRRPPRCAAGKAAVHVGRGGRVARRALAAALRRGRRESGGGGGQPPLCKGGARRRCCRRRVGRGCRSSDAGGGGGRGARTQVPPWRGGGRHSRRRRRPQLRLCGGGAAAPAGQGGRQGGRRGVARRAAVRGERRLSGVRPDGRRALRPLRRQGRRVARDAHQARQPRRLAAAGRLREAAQAALDAARGGGVGGEPGGRVRRAAQAGARRLRRPARAPPRQARRDDAASALHRWPRAARVGRSSCDPEEALYRTPPATRRRHAP